MTENLSVNSYVNSHDMTDDDSVRLNISQSIKNNKRTYKTVTTIVTN